MQLSDFIKTHGTTHVEAAKVFAKRYGFSERATLAYLYGDRRPRPDNRVAKLLKTTPVTWDGIYGKRKKSA